MPSPSPLTLSVRTIYAACVMSAYAGAATAAPCIALIEPLGIGTSGPVNSISAAAQGDNQMNGRPEIPDWAIDQHTRRGKQMGRGLKHFWEVGCYCQNAYHEPDPHFEDGLKFWTTGPGQLSEMTEHCQSLGLFERSGGQ